MSGQRATTRQRVGWIVAGLLVLVLGVAGVLGVRAWQERSAGDAIVGEQLRTFPGLDPATLDPAQTALVNVLKQEFADPGAGTKYAEGVEESWCADFVSWSMREAGIPLANPNSGSWRIPGVYTLQEYYQSVGRFEPIGSGYQPRTGDVLLYSDNSPFTQHTNIVLVADGAEVTTIGGNEYDDVRIHRFSPADVPGVVGIGRL